MLWTIAVILFILWILGFFVVHVGGGLIHLLLVIAVIVIVYRLVTGRPGVYVAIKDTVASFKEILEGKTDTLPEQAFFLAGTIEDVRKNAEKLAG